MGLERQLLAVMLAASAALASAGGDAAASEGGDECVKESLDGYDLGLHVGTIFILLGVSVLGCAIPFLFHLKAHPVLYAITKMGAFFGFGTILATAFIHMLTPANEQLASPCLPAAWLDAYPSWAYLFCMLAVLAMQLLDFLIEGVYLRFSGQEEAAALPSAAVISIHSSQANLVGGGGSARKAAKTHDSDDDEEAPAAPQRAASPCVVHGDGCKELLPRAADPSQVFGIYVMEAGIVFHSILVGITLGVTSGSAFKTLIVALSFHQFFEGFAIIGTAVDAGLAAGKLLVLAAFYSITTPIGIAVGIGIRQSYNGSATATLLTQGIFDAVSAGILVYVVLVELMTPHFTQSKWLREQRAAVKVLAFLALYAGAGIMAALGKWA